jgi:folate-dependent phosphoribosylglycinamide formyltransferase PurN
MALLCSRRAPGLASLLEASREGAPLRLVCAMSSEEEFPERESELAGAAGVPAFARSLRGACRRLGADWRDPVARRHYDAGTASLLAPFAPELVLLAGYLLRLTGPMLRAFPGRIVNVHGSDLARTRPGDRPRYTGLRAVRDAIFAGEEETRAAAHVVTEAVDEGPVLLRSWPFPVAPMARRALEWEALDMLRACAFAHQEWMLRAAWGPLLVRSAELFAGVPLRFVGSRPALGSRVGPWELAPNGRVLFDPPLRRAAARERLKAVP